MSTPNWAKRLHPAPASNVEPDGCTTGTASPVTAAPSDSTSVAPSIPGSVSLAGPLSDALIIAAQRIVNSSTGLDLASVLKATGCEGPLSALALGEEHWEALLKKALARNESVAQTAGAILAWYCENYDYAA